MACPISQKSKMTASQKDRIILFESFSVYFGRYEKLQIYVFGFSSLYSYHFDFLDDY